MVSRKSKAQNNQLENRLTHHKEPKVSVVLPVYNCPDYVGEAIESILKQTMADFELIVIDDGSKDNSLAVIKQYTDKRIWIFTQENQGLARTLNKGIGFAKGRYIARQDQDDISLPERFAKQVKILDANPDCALVATWAEIWQGRSRTTRTLSHPSNQSKIKFELLFDSQFVHSSVMFRKEAVEQVGLYPTDKNREPPEDYELWSRLARKYTLSNIPEVLQIYRELPESISRVRPNSFYDHLVTICAENIAWASGTTSNSPSVINISALVHNAPDRIQGRPDFSEMREILKRAVIGIIVDEDQPEFLNEAETRVNQLKSRWENLYQNKRQRKITDLFRKVRNKLRNL
jgi:hypothetical protein